MNRRRPASGHDDTDSGGTPPESRQWAPAERGPGARSRAAAPGAIAAIRSAIRAKVAGSVICGGKPCARRSPPPQPAAPPAATHPASAQVTTTHGHSGAFRLNRRLAPAAQNPATSRISAVVFPDPVVLTTSRCDRNAA